MTQKPLFHPLGRGLSRRQFIAASAAGSAALAFGGSRAFAQSGDSLKVGFISPRTGPLAGFGETDGYVLDLARKALADGIELGGKKFSVEILDQDTQSDPSRAGAARQGSDQQPGHRSDARGVDARDHQPGRRRVRGGGRSLPFDRHAVGGLVFRPRRQARRAVTVQMDLPFRLWRRRVLQDLHLAVEADRDQQEGRRHVSQRRRRQRHPRQPRAAARQGGLHHRRPGRLRNRHRPTIPRRSRCSSRRASRSSTPSRSRRTSPPSGGRPRSRVSPSRSRSRRSPRPACSRRTSRRSATSARTSPAPPTGTRHSPTSRR